MRTIYVLQRLKQLAGLIYEIQAVYVLEDAHTEPLHLHPGSETKCLLDVESLVNQGHPRKQTNHLRGGLGLLGRSIAHYQVPSHHLNQKEQNVCGF